MSKTVQKPSSSSSTALDVSKLEAELECYICLSLFEEPKQLNCGHICCANCLRRLVDMANGWIGIFLDGIYTKTISCPVCRQESKVPKDGQFPTAFVVKNLVSHMKGIKTQNSNGNKKNITAMNQYSLQWLFVDFICGILHVLKHCLFISIFGLLCSTLLLWLNILPECIEALLGHVLVPIFLFCIIFVAFSLHIISLLASSPYMDALKVQIFGQEAEKIESMIESKEKLAATEYANLIEVPTVAKLKVSYNREKLLLLILHGNSITKSLYIQNNQGVKDLGIVESIVDLLATAKDPKAMIGEVVIERGTFCFAWPQNGKLILKEKKPNMPFTFNDTSGNMTTFNGWNLAEYELINKGCRFQVDIYYGSEYGFSKYLHKFICRRLP